MSIEVKGNSGCIIEIKGDKAVKIANNKQNSETPKDKPKTINANLASNIEPLNVKYTRKYKKMFQKSNNKMNKTFTIWRPVPPEGYVSLGDIATSNKLDPNDTMDSMVVMESQIKYPLHFNNAPICHLNGDENKAVKKVSFWKPKAPEGYTSLGIVINNTGQGEPESNKIIA